MRPHKVRDLIPSFAMELDRPVEEVEAVTAFFYKKLRATLSSLNGATVHVLNLGNFYVKENQLNKELAKHQVLVDQYSHNSFSEYSKRKSVQSEIDKMKALKEMLDQERQRRVGVLIKRYGNESVKKHNTDLEK